ncbi:membrane protein [Salmonella enterica subsp. enterica serovar Enteritidis str. EC20120008]|nr:membrane protein [Salmonella enterica subsp. enterica serovar Enteritidis str. EC20110361]AHO54641.1 membrane protein [Salmonella enterica subsp. enterica serovar Enteritidis str. EC20110360]AHO58968.1 membrane protein [Salmonella enterica subsp. enterica serovar Enteritidis str. EC20110359]AHO63336.1 membrane protein [Salmonella enterica subsp. enterica serovar Enteritidis str. EC20110358]AHO67681.1 membrane protein [Salmonella enterica subsp. enterica serovar Enteritidis str. EC20110357]A
MYFVTEWRHACLLGAVMCLMDTPVRTLSCTLLLLFFSLSVCRWMLSRHQLAKAPPYINPNSQKRCVPALSLARLKR